MTTGSLSQKHKHVLKNMIWKSSCHLLLITTIRKRKIAELVKSLSISEENVVFSKFELLIFEQNVTCSSDDSKRTLQIDAYFKNDYLSGC